MRIVLDNLQVPAVSQRSVRPLTSRSYNLSAVVGNARKSLGNVNVQVDLSSCEEILLLDSFRVQVGNRNRQPFISCTACDDTELRIFASTLANRVLIQ